MKEGKNIKYVHNGFKIDIFKPYTKGAVSVQCRGHFEARGNVEYTRLVSKVKTRITRSLNALFNKSIVLVYIPDVIKPGKRQNVMVEYVINHPSELDLKKDYLFLDSIRQMNEKIIDDEMVVICA